MSCICGFGQFPMGRRAFVPICLALLVHGASGSVIKQKLYGLPTGVGALLLWLLSTELSCSRDYALSAG